eukprot:11199363-Lingulodinium_polyedra.AAC.1
MEVNRGESNMDHFCGAHPETAMLLRSWKGTPWTGWVFGIHGHQRTPLQATRDASNRFKP